MANQVVFKYGTRSQYDGLETKATNALYFLTDTGEIYRGDVNLARGSHYEGTRALVDGVLESDLTVINRVLTAANKIAVVDDIFVIKTPIGETAKFSYSSFVYDGTNWCAMDGNYDASNVYFDSDMTVTENIGAFVIPEGQSNAKLESAGKSLKEVLESLLAQELQPIRESEPQVTVVLKIDGQAVTTTTKSIEVGTSITPSWEASLSAGEYTYGPATGIVASNWSITDSRGNSATTATGAFDAFVVGDDEAYKITATATYADGAIPETNLGNPAEDGIQFLADSATATSNATIRGYRPYFYGSVTDKLIDEAGNVLINQINSDVIRGLSKGTNAYNAKRELTITAIDGAQSFIVAYPSDSIRSGLTDAVIQGSIAISVASSYKKATETVDVTGGAYTATKPYTVWVYSPSKITAGETHKVTLA